MDIDGIHHVRLAVSDLPEAVQFYERVIELDPVGPADEDATVESANRYWFRVGFDQFLALDVTDPDTPPSSSTLDDPQVVLASDEAGLTALRARLDAAGHDRRESTASLRFRDPAGNVIEVTTWSGPD